MALINTPLMWFKAHEEVKKISKDTIRLQKKATTLQTKGMRKQMKNFRAPVVSNQRL
jgi:hypothetical protein